MHRIVLLFNPTMILFQLIIEVFTCAMLHMITHDLVYCSWIGSMPIGCYLLRSRANHSNCLLEKSLSCLHIPLFAQHGIYQIAIVINRPVQIAPLPMNLEIRFIDVPGSPCLPIPLSSQLVRKQRGKSSFPIPDRFVGESPSTLQKHFSHITKTQFVAQTPNDDKEDDIRRVFEVVEGGARALVKQVFAG